MSEPHFITGHLPFWIGTYVLAALGWTCIGRFGLQFVMGPDNPNYIWRAFRRLTDWLMAVAARLVPSFVPPVFLPLVAAFWLWLLRLGFGIAMLAAGLAPRVGPAARAAVS